MNQMTAVAKQARISSIDVLRGLVMLIMLMDHVRERFYLHMQVADPMDVDSTAPALFFSRLAAHLCAPIFVFLTGLSAWLYANPAQVNPGSKPRSVSTFLAKRGLFLILLEATLVNFSWFGAYRTLYLQVIWAIGGSMLCLAAAVHLPRLWIGILGALIVFGHNALTPIQVSPGDAAYLLWTILHDRGFLLQEGIIRIKASYPVLPWIGVILLGYFAGPLFKGNMDTAKRQTWLIRLGIGCLALLAILRGLNIYGETLSWQVHSSEVVTLMDFLNFTKYPASLHFLLLTIGIGFLLLALFERWQSAATEVMRTFGAAPMFFYILHLYVLLVMYAILVSVFGTNMGAYFGFSQMWHIWLTTIILAVVLYWPTKAFGRYKRTSDQAWTKYF